MALEMDIHRIIEDYKKLETNAFWQYYQSDLKERQEDVLKRLGQGQSMSESLMRSLQGEYAALIMIEKRPSRLIEKLGERLTALEKHHKDDVSK